MDFRIEAYSFENTIRLVDVHLDISLTNDGNEFIEVRFQLTTCRLDLLKRALLTSIDKNIEVSLTSERLLEWVIRIPVLAEVAESRPESGDDSVHGRCQIGIIEKEIRSSLQGIDAIEHHHCRVVEISRHVQYVFIEQSRVDALQEPAQILDVARLLDLLWRYLVEFSRPLRVVRDDLGDGGPRELLKRVFVIYPRAGVRRKVIR